MDPYPERRWRLLSPRMSAPRAQKLERYATQFLEPALASFPELRRPVFLLLRSQGFIGRTEPVYTIVVKEDSIDRCSEWRLRCITADMLLYFVQNEAGMQALPYATGPFLSGHAAFFMLARGYAYDFLKTFQCGCGRAVCDFGYAFCRIRCGRLFKRPCKSYTDAQLKAMADYFQEKGAAYGFLDHVDFEEALYHIMAEAEKTL
ncbi:MAG TPA: hypothetical protein VN366_05500 [Feifaniaceae bacterium]|nr:hypothetical protein [Feifaniaceae bacterium]